MSEQTHDQLAQAIQTHIADEHDGNDKPILTDWVLATAAVAMTDQPGEMNYRYWGNGGAQHATRGLILMLSDWDGTAEEDED